MLSGNVPGRIRRSVGGQSRYCQRQAAGAGSEEPVGWSPPACTSVLAALTLVLAVAMMPLSLAARQNPLATGGPNVVVFVAFAVVAVVVAPGAGRATR